MNKNKKNKSNLITNVIAIFGFLFVLTLGFKSSDSQNELSKNEKIENKSMKNNEVVLDIEKNISNKETLPFDDINNNENNDLEITSTITKIKDNNIDNDKNNDIDNEIIKNNDVYVNKIVISKNIDNDTSSDNYRNPIDSYKTITTKDKDVLKEIKYHPNFYIWSSINTENKTFLNESGDFVPLEMSMDIICSNEIIQNLNFTITANTPRWREWIKIDLNELENKFLNQMWTVEIKNNSNDKVVESRSFKLISDNEVYVLN